MKRLILISTCIGSSVSSFLIYGLFQLAFKRPPFKMTTITAVPAWFSERLTDFHLSDLIFPPGLPGGANSKEFACKYKRHRLDPWVGNISWKRKWHPTPVFLPEEFHGQRSLVGHSPQHHKEQNMTEGLGHACIFISLTLIKHRITRENQITKNSSNLHAVVIQSTAEADNCSFSTTRKACDCNPPKIIRLMFSSLPCLHVSC